MIAFLCSPDNIKTVYPPYVLDALTRENGGNEPMLLTGEDIPKRHAAPRAGIKYLFSTWGFPSMEREEIAYYFPDLKAVFYAAGSVQAFARPLLENGVRVFSAWQANAVPVAEFTAAQILLANKGYFQSLVIYKTADFNAVRIPQNPPPGNFQTKVGLIGIGSIGSAVAKLLAARNLELLAYDPYLSDEKAAALSVKKVPLETLFEECQTVSNHLANNAATKGMLNYDLFKRLKPAAAFINTGRGAQVVEGDLIRALKEEPLRTALLDVTQDEPCPAGHPFYSLPNVFLTPHIAGSIGREVYRMAEYMLDEFYRIKNGGKPLYEVDLNMLETMA
jgi:phosphoglycerate dehydrogenase-like enzyme